MNNDENLLFISSLFCFQTFKIIYFFLFYFIFIFVEHFGIFLELILPYLSRKEFKILYI
jgi:hypothetical protein